MSPLQDSATRPDGTRYGTHYRTMRGLLRDATKSYEPLRDTTRRYGTHYTTDLRTLRIFATGPATGRYETRYGARYNTPRRDATGRYETLRDATGRYEARYNTP